MYQQHDNKHEHIYIKRHQQTYVNVSMCHVSRCQSVNLILGRNSLNIVIQ